MRLSKIKKFAVLAVCVAFFISFICLYCKKDSAGAVKKESVALTVWQIDSFEGGKGSRADYLQSVGNDFSKKEDCYVNVISLSSEAARLNLANGNVPDLVSYGAGIFGIENYVKDYVAWCHGCYCLISLDTNCDFSDASAQNTVINSGKDNFTTVAALFCGVQGGKFESSTSAYVKLINGDFKYLLGTQRDIFRLKTRNVAFSVKAVTAFNDLYQNISVTTKCLNSQYAKRYIDYLLSKSGEINKIGMLTDKTKLYEDEMSVCENLSFDNRLTYPISEGMKSNIEKCVSLEDINMIKELLK